MAESALTFPKQEDKHRIQRYTYFDRLFEGDHYSAFAIRGEAHFSDQYNRLKYVAVNFPGLITRILADLLFSEPVKFVVNEKGKEKNKEFIDALVKENNLHTQNYESALGNSRRGDAVYKLRIGRRNPAISNEPLTIIIEDINPAIYYPEINHGNFREEPQKKTLAWLFHQGDKCFLRKEIHEPQKITNEVWTYDEKKDEAIMKLGEDQVKKMLGVDAVQLTKTDELWVIHIPNTRDGSSYWGYSDYRDLYSLFFALNNRISKIDNILDKHSDPILAVPDGIIDENGQIKKEAMGMIEMSSADGANNKPEYIVWDANLEAAFKEIERIIDFVYMASEISPASVGMDKGGEAESGRKFKLKLQRTLAKTKRKQVYYEQALKQVMTIAQKISLAHNIPVGGVKISEVAEVEIEWSDGVMNDTRELAEELEIRLRAGIISKAQAIAEMDGITLEEAEKRAKKITEEEGLALPLETNPVGNKNKEPEMVNGRQRSTTA